VIGAHYDSVMGSPGANDNATGIAAVLEISKALKNSQLKKTLYFVAFVNEEPPFFRTPKMGSAHFAKKLTDERKNIVAMASLETIGYYDPRKGMQHYPPLFGFFYPSEANFIAVVGNLGSFKLVQKFKRYFQEESDFHVESLAAPGIVPGVDWSDQRSFWKYGYQAVMITDTAPYRYPYYHGPEDFPDKIKYPQMTQVVEGLSQVILRLAND